ncbi:MAG: peptidoglycan-binding protein LysM [marine benthic group bacterium]|jgi:nucleoid-associated protein YgaU|nr:peptidoglycan-binding protein LysM [Gemmatimonadota bacterium]MCL7962265.1 peptidoglycan-binding protein LysM [Candidatus Carthagonibacter metallireducens]MCL7937457.1 peptidoglycan-binding protein LysM [Gemmatimonadota bacterium]MCL7956513.1 peptidoglycan-binding protein LysM [Gemmatimonadota bacterium]MCL7969116.1 peptidoglycan-binding protein LysM [Gemmatimonadota bacterium]
MGIFDFWKDSGEEVEVDAGEAVDLELQNQMQGNAIARTVIGLGLEVEELRVTYSDGIATVNGKVPSQAEAEKVVLAVGNTKGVEQVDSRLIVEEPAPEATMYTVQHGDSLSKIAKEQYGDPMKYPMIFEANQPMLKDPDKIYPGQVLRIPVLD